MTKGRGDDHRTLPALPESIPVLEESAAGLALEGPAAPGPFLVEGERAFVLGEQREGLSTITIDGVPTLAGLDTALGTAANIVAYPGMVRREFVTPTGICLETIVVPPTLPCVVIQWGTEGGTVPERILFDLPQEGLNPQLERDPEGVALTFSEGRVVALSSSPPPLAIEVLDSVGDAVRVSLRPPDTGPFHLIIAAGPRSTIRSAFAASGHLSAHARRAATGPCEGGLTLRTGVTEVDEAVAWARARLRGILDRAATIGSHDSSSSARFAPGPSALTTGLAAIGVGDRQGARQAMKACRSDGTPTCALLAARFASSFGDGSFALKQAHALMDAGRPDAGTSGAEGLSNGLAAFHPPALRAVALRTLAEGLRYTAPESLIAQLRQAALATEEAQGSALGVAGVHPPTGTLEGTRLPVVGAPPRETSWATWLPTLLSGEPSMPAPDGSPGQAAVLRRAAALFRTDPDAAWVDWRHELSVGLTGGPAGPGSWDRLMADEDPAPDSATAWILLVLAHGLLGLDPDAPVGRLRIAPRLPQQLTSVEVRGITLGDATLRMKYRQEGPSHLFTLEPEIASVPPLVVFEPSVYGRIFEIRVDGLIADLNTRSVGPMMVASLQLPIDALRSVEIITEQ